MTDLWLPPRHEADAERQAVIDEGRSQTQEAARITTELRKIDPYISLVFVGDRAPAYPGLVPGRWHILRSQPGEIDVYRAFLGPDGEYVPPSQKFIDDMKEADLWRQGALQELQDRQDKLERDKEKARELEAEQRRDEIALTWRAAKRVAGDGGLKKRKWAKGLVGS